MTALNLSNRMNPVVREIDGRYVVWFANGNQFLRLEEPAYWVFHSDQNGLSREAIINQCAEKYYLPLDESRVFVTDVLHGIEDIKQWTTSKIIDYLDDEEILLKKFTVFSLRNYSINGRLMRFHFETLQYEHYLHPLLQHLESDLETSVSILFEIFGYNDRVVLRMDQQIKGIWNKDDSHLINGMVFLQLLNAAYDKNDQDWLAVIHASAVTNGNKTIVFAASPGSGKSTIAAMMQHKGFSLVSDDFVPIERLSQLAFPFPSAMSVKEGTTELLSVWYPSLQSEQEPQLSRTNKLVRYLPVDGKAVPAPVKEIILIKYDPAVDFEIEKLSRTEALKMLLDETWTSPSAENAGRFLDWYCGISCFRLTYSNNEKALQTIIRLFEQ
jgi:hypothetical protein